MLCNDCEQLPKCECCGKPLKSMNIVEPILNKTDKPLIPAIPMDDEKIPADKPRKQLNIQPPEEMNGLVDVFMKGWG